MIDTTPAQQIDQAFFYILAISIVALVGITATMIYFVVRYQRDRHPVSADIRGNWLLETIWIIIPTIIALSMFNVGWDSYISLKNVPAGALEIEAVGEMYAWVFVYPEGKESEAELYVPQHRAIKIKATSLDVLHSIFIPAFRLKLDAVPGMHTEAWFMPNKLGNYDIHCAEFCGGGHSRMNAILKVVPEEQYLDWVNTEEEVDDDW